MGQSRNNLIPAKNPKNRSRDVLGTSRRPIGHFRYLETPGRISLSCIFVHRYVSIHVPAFFNLITPSVRVTPGAYFLLHSCAVHVIIVIRVDLSHFSFRLYISIIMCRRLWCSDQNRLVSERKIFLKVFFCILLTNQWTDATQLAKLWEFSYRMVLLMTFYLKMINCIRKFIFEDKFLYIL